MANGKISLAAGKVRGLYRLDKLKRDSRWRRVFGRAADMPGEKRRCPFADRYSHRAAQRRHRSRTMPFEGQGGVLQLLGNGHQGGTRLIEPQSLGHSIEQGRSTEDGLERSNSPTDRRLAYAKGSTGGA